MSVDGVYEYLHIVCWRAWHDAVAEIEYVSACSLALSQRVTHALLNLLL